ncbi:MAG: metal-sensing transcriptional repressor [Spirochaetia bacterium]|jgi:DNA-binding FrmR family transcriptional regulator|nr:metal-sensing transcriptional repressor [Spirochaetia bacterium]
MDHCSTESQKALALLKNARGQAEAAIRMIEEDRYCIDVSKQILAAAAMLKKANLLVLRQHIDTCVKDAIEKGQGKEKVDEIVMVLERYVGGPD